MAKFWTLILLLPEKVCTSFRNLHTQQQQQQQHSLKMLLIEFAVSFFFKKIRIKGQHRKCVKMRLTGR